MINVVGGYQKWARSVVGRKLLRVNGVIYSLETHDFSHPQQLQLVFQKLKRWRVLNVEGMARHLN